MSLAETGTELGRMTEADLQAMKRRILIKGTVTIGLLAPLVGALLFVPIGFLNDLLQGGGLSFSVESGGFEALLGFGMFVVVLCVYGLAIGVPYSVPVALLGSWLAIQWALRGIGGKALWFRGVLLGSTFGVLFPCYMALGLLMLLRWFPAAQGSEQLISSHSAAFWSNYSLRWLSFGVPTGMLSGVLLLTLLRSDLAALRTARAS